jgi:hypothetical protein
MIGIEERDTKSGIHVFRVHYTADAMKREPGWKEEAARGMVGGVAGRSWRREMEIDWTIASGLPVYADTFLREIHVAKEPLAVYESLPIYRGWDFGLTPACVWAQLDPMHRLNVLGVQVVWDGRGPIVQMGIERFAPLVQITSEQKFPGAKFIDYADPAGWQKAQTDEKSCVDIMRRFGIYPIAGPVTWTARKAAMSYIMEQMSGGRASLQFSPTCTLLIEGMEGSYRYEEIESTGRYKETVEKNAWSHPMNALEYIVGALYRTLNARRHQRDDEEERRQKRRKKHGRDSVVGY